MVQKLDSVKFIAKMLIRLFCSSNGLGLINIFQDSGDLMKECLHIHKFHTQHFVDLLLHYCVEQTWE